MENTKMRRADRALSREAAFEAIDRSTFGTVSMCAPDGTPYAVALNLVRDGGKLYYHAAYEGLKGDLLRQNPKVCVLFVDGAEIDEPGLTTHYASAVVRGTARELTDLEEKRAAPALRAFCAEHPAGADRVHRNRPGPHGCLVHRHRIGHRQAQHTERISMPERAADQAALFTSAPETHAFYCIGPSSASPEVVVMLTAASPLPAIYSLPLCFTLKPHVISPETVE